MRGAALMCLFALCAALSMHYWIVAKQSSASEPYNSIVPLVQGYSAPPGAPPTPTIIDARGILLRHAQADADE